jgi:site-specific DNA-methyltransferase (adenine-specific)
MADLPYGTTRCKWDTVIDLPELWRAYERCVKPNGAILLFGQTPFDKVLGASNLKMLRYEWVWEKPHATGFLNANRMPLKAHENILVFYKKLPTYNPQHTHGHPPVNSYTKRVAVQNNTVLYGRMNTELSGGGSTSRYPRSVVTFSADTQRLNLHPTQKPVALMEYLVKTYTNAGDRVLDNTAGSGTTGEACANLGRAYTLIESDPQIFLTAANRLGLATRPESLKAIDDILKSMQ